MWVQESPTTERFLVRSQIPGLLHKNKHNFPGTDYVNLCQENSSFGVETTHISYTGWNKGTEGFAGTKGRRGGPGPPGTLFCSPNVYIVLYFVEKKFGRQNILLSLGVCSLLNTDIARNETFFHNGGSLFLTIYFLLIISLSTVYNRFLNTKEHSKEKVSLKSNKTRFLSTTILRIVNFFGKVYCKRNLILGRTGNHLSWPKPSFVKNLLFY